MKRIIALLAISFAMPGWAADDVPTYPEIATGPVLVMTRHAEKQAGEDPCLTEEGRARAQRLAAMLAHMPVKALFSTDYCRTRETLEPLASSRELAILPYAPRETARLRDALHDGRNGAVVVSGHSNTVPALAEKFGASIPDIAESEYDNLYLLFFNRKGEVTGLARLSY